MKRLGLLSLLVAALLLSSLAVGCTTDSSTTSTSSTTTTSSSTTTTSTSTTTTSSSTTTTTTTSSSTTTTTETPTDTIPIFENPYVTIEVSVGDLFIVTSEDYFQDLTFDDTMLSDEGHESEFIEEEEFETYYTLHHFEFKALKSGTTEIVIEDNFYGEVMTYTINIQ